MAPYKVKTNHRKNKQYDPENLEKAKKLVLDKKLSCNKAAKTFQIPEPTLRLHVNAVKSGKKL